MIDSAIFSYLSSVSGISALVAERIYPVHLPSRPSYPAITFNSDSHDLEKSFDGQSTFTRSNYSVHAWASTLAAAETLGGLIRTALKNYSGTAGTIIIDKVFIVAGPLSFFEDSVNAYRISQNFEFFHQEG